MPTVDCVNASSTLVHQQFRLPFPFASARIRRGAVLALQRTVARAMKIGTAALELASMRARFVELSEPRRKKVRAGAGMRRLAGREPLGSRACRRAPVAGTRGFATAEARRARQHRCDGLARRPGRMTGAWAWPPRPRSFRADRNRDARSAPASRPQRCSRHGARSLKGIRAARPSS